MSNNLITIIIFLSVFIFFIIPFIVIFVIFKKMIDYWQKYFNKAKWLLNNDELIKNIFNINNLSKRFFEANWNPILLAYTLLISLQLSIELITGVVLVVIFFPSIIVAIILFILIIVKTAILMFSLKWQVNKFDKNANKNFYKNIQIYKYVYSCNIPVVSNKKDNIELWNSIYKLFYRSLDYIKNYNCLIFNTRMYYSRFPLVFYIDNKVRDVADVDKASFDISYVCIIKEYKIIEKILEYKIIDCNSKEQLTKEQIINYLVSKVFILSTTYIEKLHPQMIIVDAKKCVNKALSLNDDDIT